MELKSKKTQEIFDFIEDKKRLEILIISNQEQFQEVEIIYGDKRIRKKITRRLPSNLASNSFISSDLEKPLPSMNIGATNLTNLSKDPRQEFQNSLLKEKFLRILIKVKQMQQNLFDEIGNFNYEKFWDGSERINIDEIFNKLSEAKKTKLREQEAIRRKGDLTTSDKAILVAVINQFRPQGEKVNRIIVSLKFSEIADKNSFKQFVDEIIELITEDEKLSDALFPNLNYGEINAEKKNAIKSCLNNIINESDDSRRNHQMQFLTKIVGEIMKTQQNNR